MQPERWTRVLGLLEEALAIPEDEREGWLARLAGDDAELAGELRSLLDEDRASPGFLEPDMHGLGASGERLGSFELERELASGGMGSVWLGRRVEGGFEQRVAVKLLRPGMHTRELLARFRLERAVLAGLEHPGIARLIDGGTGPQGQPYLVMEYIDGQPIDRWCDEHELGVRQRVDLFAEVCEAVAFAHRNLVVHRDLKPGNILIDADGRARLLDFGIAKVLAPQVRGATAERTAEGLGFLTPEYASPEQVRGAPISTASDVYSLGAVLYRLLTGRQPHQFRTRTPLEIDRVVCEEPPTRPSQVVATDSDAHRAFARRLRGDLDAIVLQCLRKEPERRYGSVEALADDLRRWRAGLPVRARPDSLAYRAQRFVGRNRLALGAAAAVFAALTAGLVSSWSLYRDTLDAWSAEGAQRGLAERRAADLRGLATGFVFDVHDRLVDVPRTLEVRAAIVRTAGEHLERLAAESADDPDLTLELAQAWLRLGDAQGQPFANSLGDTQAALVSYGRALEGLRSPIAAGADPVARARLESYALRAGADVLAQQGEHQAALEGFQVALAVLDRARPGDDLVGARLRALRGLADTELALGRNEQGLAHHTQAVDLAREVWLRAPEAARARDLASALVDQARRQLDQDRFDDAEDSSREALEVIEPVQLDDPTWTPARRVLAAADLVLAMTLGEVLPVEPEARERLAEALRLYEGLLAEDPRDLGTRRDLAKTTLRFGEQFCWQGDWEGGLPLCERSLREWRAISALDPANLGDRREVAVVEDRIGSALYQLGRHDEALAALDAARDFWTAQLSGADDSARARRDLAVNRYYAAFCEANRVGEAAPRAARAQAVERGLEAFGESLELMQSLDAEGLLMPADRSNLVHLGEMMAKYEAKLDELVGEPE